MKKIIYWLFTLAIIAVFSGCTGIITGHEYSKKDLVIVYKVVKGGVTTFMTPEQIQDAQLNKLDVVVTDSYKLITAEEAAEAAAEAATENGDQDSQSGKPVPETETGN